MVSHTMKPYFKEDAASLFQGNASEVLAQMPAESINCCITSPPYWRLRDYDHDAQLGKERTIGEYVQNLLVVFREVFRVLTADGTAWLNLGDGYASREHEEPGLRLKRKDLCGVPWRVALALQQDGWYLRQDEVWHKTNVQPEGPVDRCTKAHEYVFFLSKNADHYWDSDAIKEKASPNTHSRGHGVNPKAKHEVAGSRQNRSFSAAVNRRVDWRNKRSVWSIPTAQYEKAHFSTFPPNLVVPCILAGCPPGGVVVDPFVGSGTTAMVAKERGRVAIGIDISWVSLDLAMERLSQGVLPFGG